MGARLQCRLRATPGWRRLSIGPFMDLVADPTLGRQPRRRGPGPCRDVVQSVLGSKMKRVGEPVKSAESRANTHSGVCAKTLLDDGSTISRP